MTAHKIEDLHAFIDKYVANTEDEGEPIELAGKAVIQYNRENNTGYTPAIEAGEWYKLREGQLKEEAIAEQNAAAGSGSEQDDEDPKDEGGDGTGSR